MGNQGTANRDLLSREMVMTTSKPNGYVSSCLALQPIQTYVNATREVH